MFRNLKHHFLLILVSLWGIPFGMSQTWLPLDKGIECLYGGTLIRDIVVDTVTDRLFVSGTFVEDGNCVIMRGVAQWDGQRWDSVGLGSEGNATKLGMTMYNDTLYVTGNFYDLNNNFYFGKWNGTFWDTLPHSPYEAWAFAEKNGILYMGGPFDYLTGDSTYMITKYDGTQFTGDIPYCFSGEGNSVNAMVFYHDTLYVAGYYDLLTCKGLGSLGKWDGNDLQLVSPEFANDGGNCNIEAMVEYQDELYIGGYFLQSHGYAGNYIMKWNGSTFSPVGTGMNGRVKCMKVYNNKLYVGGYFTDAGGVASTSYIAMWDGSNWNSITTDAFDAGEALISVEAIDVYRDSLIIGGSFTSINGDTACRKIAKYNSALTGIGERSRSNVMSLFPNPANDQITIEFTSALNTVLEIKNIFGQTLYNETIKSIPAKQSKSIDISAFSKGVYFIRINSGETVISSKFIKN